MLSALFVAALIQTALPGAQNTTRATIAPPVQANADTRTSTADDEAARRQTCRMEPVTGSRFPVRVCRTSRQTTSEARTDAQETLRRLQGLRELPGD